jgi:DNA-binding NarL/FixJ family response regulator
VPPNPRNHLCHDRFGGAASPGELHIRDGVELCRELTSRLPELPCLMLTSFGDDEALFNAIMAGASGFVLKQVLGADLLSAIRAVASGQSLLDPRSTTALLNRLRRELRSAELRSKQGRSAHQFPPGDGDGAFRVTARARSVGYHRVVGRGR